MATTNVKVRSGNRIAVVFDGIQIGLVQSVQMADDYGPEPASGVGDIHVQEYVPTIARHSLSVSAMVLIKGSMLQAGIVPENGDGALLGLVFDIVSYGTDDTVVLRKYSGCTYASGSIEVSKHAIVMQSGQFLALDVSGTGS
jgi:hypothetical protein